MNLHRRTQQTLRHPSKRDPELAVFKRLAAGLGLRLLRQQLIKHKVHEAFERRVTFFSLRTQERPLPTVEYKTRQELGIRSCRKFLLRNCLADDRGKRMLPVIERCADSSPQLRTLAGDLQTEASHHASGNRSHLAIHLHEIAEVTPQALQWRSRHVV